MPHKASAPPATAHAAAGLRSLAAPPFSRPSRSGVTAMAGHFLPAMTI